MPKYMDKVFLSSVYMASGGEIFNFQKCNFMLKIIRNRYFSVFVFKTALN